MHKGESTNRSVINFVRPVSRLRNLMIFGESCGHLSLEFTKRNSTRQDCLLSSYLFKMSLRRLWRRHYPHVRMVTLIFARTGNCDLEYADDSVLLSEGPSKLPVFLDCLNVGINMFGAHFAPSMCKSAVSGLDRRFDSGFTVRFVWRWKFVFNRLVNNNYLPKPRDKLPLHLISSW